MIAVFGQIFILFVFALAGYVISKLGLIKAENAGILSALLVNVFLPCKVFQSFASNVTIQVMTEKYSFILISAAILLVTVIIATVISRLLAKNKYEGRVLKYSMTIANLGYMGYTLVEALYGEIALFNMMVYAIPINLYIYTGGYCLLLKKKLSFKKLVNPVTVAMILGCVAGLTGIKLPDLALEILVQGGSCMGPVSMLLAGIVVSEFNFKELILNRNVWIVSAIRLIVVPVAVWAVLKPFCGIEVIMPAVLVTCMPCGLNGVVFPKLIGEDCKEQHGYCHCPVGSLSR